MVTQTLKQPDKELLPSRPCTSCGEHFEAPRLTWVGGQWFCRDCHLEWKARQQTPPQYAGATVADEKASGSRFERIERMNNIFRFGGGFLRFGCYGVAVYLATQHQFVDQFLHGVVFADILTWIALCWFDARFNKLPVLFEFIGFVILTTILLGRDHAAVLENNATLGMAFLGFLVTFGTKGLYRLHRHWATSG